MDKKNYSEAFTIIEITTSFVKMDKHHQAMINHVTAIYEIWKER
ncbi:MAG: hypothetical protein ACK48W_07420 [Bacteroidota bacterium]|jgi:hypothetical protein